MNDIRHILKIFGNGENSAVEITMIMLVIFFAVAVAAHFLLRFILKIKRKIAAKSKTRLDDYLVAAASLPLKVLLWFAWLYFSIGLIGFENLDEHLEIAFFVIVAWGLIRLVGGVEKYLLTDKQALDYDFIHLLARLGKILIAAVVVLSLLQHLGFSISSILTFGGVGGIVVGFAAKDMLANIFGGIMIQLDRPFSTGDWIRITDQNIEGVVEKIGWRMTRIRTFTRNPIYIPNSTFSTIPIETPSRMTNRRIKEIIGIRYDDINQIRAIVKATNKMLAEHPLIDHNLLTHTFFDNFNASSLDIVVYAFTTCTEKIAYQKAKQDVLLKIAEIIQAHNAEIAYPTRTVHVQK